VIFLGGQCSRFLLLFLGCGEENVVQDKAVSGRMLVQTQVGCFLPNKVLIVLGVMSPVKGKCPFTEGAM
jgi:hypothetical protein